MATIPNFAPTAFTAAEAIDNPYYPLTLGTVYVYEGEALILLV